MEMRNESTRIEREQARLENQSLQFVKVVPVHVFGKLRQWNLEWKKARSYNRTVSVETTKVAGSAVIACV